MPQPKQSKTKTSFQTPKNETVSASQIPVALETFTLPVELNPYDQNAYMSND